MSFSNYYKSRSFLFVYELVNNEVIIFDRNKRRLSYILCFFYIYEVIQNVFHAIANNHHYRLYLTPFLCTKTRSQYIFDIGVIVTHSSILRVYYYLFLKDNEFDRKKFKWLYFLQLDNPQILVKEHHFTKKNADRYLLNLSRIITFVKLNDFLFASACGWVFGRVIYFAVHEIPLIWVFLLTIPLAIVYEVIASFAYILYNYHFTIFFAISMFINKNLKSLSNRYSRHSLHELSKEKLNSFAVRNIFQFNYLIKQFYYSQLNISFTLSFCNGLMAICMFQSFENV